MELEQEYQQEQEQDMELEQEHQQEQHLEQEHQKQEQQQEEEQGRDERKLDGGLAAAAAVEASHSSRLTPPPWAVPLPGWPPATGKVYCALA